MALEQDPSLNTGNIDFTQRFQLNVPKPGENRFNVPTPPGTTPPTKLANTVIGKTAKETEANINSFLTSNIDYNNYGKISGYDAGPNGANLARYQAYGEETFNKIGFDPSINNETKFNEGTTWWDDTKRMLTNSFLPLYGNGLMANLKSYVDMGRADFGQDIRASANYEKYSNLGYSSKSGVTPFISNTVMSYAYTAGILTEAVAEAFILRKIAPSVFGGKDFLLSAPKSAAQFVKSSASYLKDLRNVNTARAAFSKAYQTGANFLNPAAHTWDNFVTNIYRNEDNITNLARSQRTFGAFYKDIRNINMAFSEAKLEGGFVENKMFNDLYNDHYFRTGEVPDDKTMELYQRKAEAAGFSATMQNAALVFYTNKITLPTLMNLGPFKALNNTGKELVEGSLLRSGKGLTAKTAYQKRNLVNSLKNLYNPRTWGKGGLNYFTANLMEGIQENLQDVIADSTQQYYTSTIFTPEKGKFEMYSAALRDGFAKQWSKEGLETFASGFLMGFGNTIVNGSIQNLLAPGYKYLKDGKSYINYLDERHEAGQDLSDTVNAYLDPTKLFGSREFDLGNQALLRREVESSETDEKEKNGSKKTSLISSVLAALDTGTFDMHIDNIQSLKNMTETEIEDTFKLKAGEGKKALDRVDSVLERAKTIQRKYDIHQSRFGLQVNPNDYKEGTIEREYADLMVQAHNRAKYNAIFLDSTYEFNLERISSMGKTFTDFANYVKSDAKIMMSDINAIYDREALKTEIKLLEAEVDSAQGITDPEVVAQKEANVKKLERLKKYDKAQSDYDAIEQSRLNGKNGITEAIRNKILESGTVTEEEQEALEDLDEQIISKINEIENSYKQAFKDYLVDVVGGEGNYQDALLKAEAEKVISIDEMFKMLQDIKKLDVENQAILKYANVLKDPGGYYEHVQKNYKWMRALYATRKEHVRQMIEKSLQIKEYQDLLKSLSDDGVFIDLDEFAKWVQNKNYMPKEFIDVTKELVIPRESDKFLEYYSRFIKVARAQEERIANEKINKEQSLKDRTEELDKMKQKELDDARTAYLKEIKSETGKSESELIKARAEFEKTNKAKLDELQKIEEDLVNFLNLIKAVNSPVLLASFEQVKQRLIDTDKVLEAEVYNQLQLDAENIPEQFAEVTKIFKEKQKTLKNVSEESVLLFSIDYYILSKMIQDKLNEIKPELEKAGALTDNPNIDFKNTSAYKVYQKRISDIEKRYAEALEDSKQDIENFDDDAPRRAQINVATPWEQLPKDLVDILQPKFDKYAEGKDFDEEDLYEIRQNWLLTQNSTIQTYLGASVGTAEEALPVSEKIPKLKTLPKDQQDLLDASKVNDLKLTVGIRKVMQKKLDKKPEKGETPLTKEARAAIQADIESLQKYINYQRSVATPQERLESIVQDFLDTITELQKEVGENVVNGRRQNYVLDQGKDTETIPQRVTELTEEIELEMDPTKPPFLYGDLKNPILLNAIDQLITEINEGTIKKGSAIESFITTMKTLIDMGKLKQFASENKINDVRGLLYMDAVKRGVMSKEEALLNLANAKMGKSRYAKDIEAYEPQATKPQPATAAPVATGTQADIERRQVKANIITNTLDAAAENKDVKLEEFLGVLFERGLVKKNNGATLFDLGGGRDAIIFDIDGAIVPIYRSSKGTSSKTKGEWYPFFFTGGDWLVKAGADTYKDGYNNPIIKQILDSLNKNYRYDKPIAKVEGNNQQLLSLLPLGGLNLDVSDENNSGIYDYINYAAIAVILTDWQSKLGNIDVTGYQEYLDGASSSLIKANPTLKLDIQSAFNEVSKLFAELASLGQPATTAADTQAEIKKDRYYNSPVNRMVKVQKGSENTPITKEEEEEIEAVIEKAKELGWDKNRLFRQLSSMGYSYALGVNSEGYRNYLEDRLSGKTNIKVTSEYNFFKQLDKELAALEQSAPTVDNKAAIESKKQEIAQLESEREKLLSKPPVITEETGYKPKAVIEYLAAPSIDGVWNPSTARDTPATNTSFYRLERDSKDSNTGLIYFDIPDKMSHNLAINSPNTVINQKSVVWTNPSRKAAAIKTIKPGKVRLQNGKWVLDGNNKVEIEFLNSGDPTNPALSRPSATPTEEAVTEVDTLEIDGRIAKAKEELANLEKPVTPTPTAANTDVNVERRKQLGDEIINTVWDRLAKEGITNADSLIGTRDTIDNKDFDKFWSNVTVEDLQNYKASLEAQRDSALAKTDESAEVVFNPETGEFANIASVSEIENQYNPTIEALNAEIAFMLNTSTTDETDLEDFGQEEQILSISGIINILGDIANQESSDVGTLLDDLIRDYLQFKELKLPSYMTKNHPAYIALFGPKGIISEIRDGVLEGRITILSDHVKVFDRNLGTKVNGKPIGLAGETDLILVDNITGEIEIVDIKTAKASNWLYWDIDKKISSLKIELDQVNKKLDKETNPKRKGILEKEVISIENELAKAEKKFSKKLNYSIQQTIYRNLLYRMTGKMAKIKILPLQVDYTIDGVIKNVKLANSVVDTNAKGDKSLFITLTPVDEVNKYVPIGTVKETIEKPEEVEFEETQVTSNQINNNLGKSFIYNGNAGVLIKNLDGTYSLDTPTEIIDIIINGNNQISPETTIESLALTPIKITERPFMTTSIDGVQYTLSEFDAANDSIIINGIKYNVLRTPKTKKVNGVEFMSNQLAIDEMDQKIREVSEELVSRRDEGVRDGENINKHLVKIVELEGQLELLTGQRVSLVNENKIRKITGTNAQDLIYIINQSPEIFLSDTSKSLEEENEDLKEIKSLFPSDASFQEVYEIMLTRPESLDRLLKGEVDSVSIDDMQQIREWIEGSIETINFSKNLGAEDAILMLQTLNNELTNIKFTKDGKIKKQSGQSFLKGQEEKRRSRASVSNVQKSPAGQAEGVPGQPGEQKGEVSLEEGKQIIKSIKTTARTTEGVKDIFSNLGTQEGVEGYDEIRARIMKATEEELNDIENELFEKAIRDEISISEAEIDKLLQERKFQLQENVTVKDVKKNQTVVAISPIINKETSEEMLENSIFKVKKVTEKEVVLQSLDNKEFEVTMTASQFNKKFKPYMKKTTKKAPVAKPITKEYKEASLDVIEELNNFSNKEDISSIKEAFDNITEEDSDNALLDAAKQCKTK